LGSGEAVNRIKQVQRAGVPLTVETCHHYLNLVAEEVPEGATQFKCCPPVRTRHHQEDLWRGLKEDVVNLVREKSESND
jgi:allantoinase